MACCASSASWGRFRWMQLTTKHQPGCGRPPWRPLLQQALRSLQPAPRCWGMPPGPSVQVLVMAGCNHTCWVCCTAPLSNPCALKHGDAERACRPGGVCGGRHVRGGAAGPAECGAGAAAGVPVEGLWWVAGILPCYLGVNCVKNRCRARFPWSFGKAKCRAGGWGTPAPVPSFQPPCSLDLRPLQKCLPTRSCSVRGGATRAK